MISDRGMPSEEGVVGVVGGEEGGSRGGWRLVGCKGVVSAALSSHPVPTALKVAAAERTKRLNACGDGSKRYITPVEMQVCDGCHDFMKNGIFISVF